MVRERGWSVRNCREGGCVVERVAVMFTHVGGAHVLSELSRRARRAAEVGVVVHAHGTARGRSADHKESRDSEARHRAKLHSERGGDVP